MNNPQQKWVEYNCLTEDESHQELPGQSIRVWLNKRDYLDISASKHTNGIEINAGGLTSRHQLVVSPKVSNVIVVQSVSTDWVTE